MKTAIKSDLSKRVRVLETASFWGERLRDCTAWIASMLRIRPLMSGPRLSRGPQRIVRWVLVGFGLDLWVGWRGDGKERMEWSEDAME